MTIESMPALHGVRTPLPGPRSAELLARQADRESAARSYPRRLPIALRRGSGSYVEDADGNVFIDFLNGAGVLPLGHSHPELIGVVQHQAAELAHGLDFPTAVKDEFTTALLSTLPEAMRSTARVHFSGPTGTNAVEAALKLCRTATGRSEVVAFHGGFHGMTAGSLAASSEGSLRASSPGVHFLPFAYCHRCPLGLRPESCDTNCAAYLERVLTGSHTGLARPAAVLLELVQGEGGVVVAPQEFVRRVREVTARLDIPLIVDEVQTGCGRTGRWFAFEHYEIEPDVLVLSKMLSGSGMPTAVVVYHERLDSWRPGAHTGTFRGNQLAFASGTAYLRIARRDGLLETVSARSTQLRRGLDELAARLPQLISEVRSLGLMLGVEFSHADGSPWPEAASATQQEALARGLIVEIGGRADCVVRMLPPLNLDEATAHHALELFGAAVEAVSKRFA
ncbi:aspartate aminotransferase family protein [Kutzneria viridogrisea]|uniref:Diaminobutyrate--2-oxoglutarate transaminase n=2 Tax=Kutzneria TaxID=43356 RepID=W5WDM4_9PSEU|nr:diaminobutyrate--2-oxoglutarate transaminase family protein [Kutzneria albida]AHH99278.1 hypothetical protein KALB_5917 [Kutzneria albida DSM 43870]MBA8923168.1 diaminobutyrate-2-oxoglutarate transaminase [Kutzneria viridogrisea]